MPKSPTNYKTDNIATNVAGGRLPVVLNRNPNIPPNTRAGRQFSSLPIDSQKMRGTVRRSGGIDSSRPPSIKSFAHIGITSNLLEAEAGAHSPDDVEDDFSMAEQLRMIALSTFARE